MEANMKYFMVTVKFGHVGKSNFYHLAACSGIY